MSDEVEGITPEVQSGQIYEDSVYGGEYRVKYVDDDVVLIMDLESEHHYLYAPDYFARSTSKTLVNSETRFKLQNGSEK